MLCWPEFWLGPYLRFGPKTAVRLRPVSPVQFPLALNIPCHHLKSVPGVPKKIRSRRQLAAIKTTLSLLRPGILSIHLRVLAALH